MIGEQIFKLAVQKIRILVNRLKIVYMPSYATSSNPPTMIARTFSFNLYEFLTAMILRNMPIPSYIAKT